MNGDIPILEFEHTLEISSGKLRISTPINREEDDISIHLEKGRYKIYICSNSLGKEISSYGDKYDKRMTDEEYMSHDIFEYYDVYITTSIR